MFVKLTLLSQHNVLPKKRTSNMSLPLKVSLFLSLCSLVAAVDGMMSKAIFFGYRLTLLVNAYSCERLKFMLCILSRTVTRKSLIRGLYVCAAGLDILKIDKIPSIYSVSYFNFGVAWNIVWEG